jgi:Ser/Thr protein kinase RdoA (MazF antagonist)
MRAMHDDHSEPTPAGDSAGLPFAGLTPERVLDALDSVLIPAGLRTDGRLLALNSYENRVYQAGIEDGQPIVAKFYRPRRWSDAAILEEHGFVAELAAREIPAVPARAFEGRTLRLIHYSAWLARRWDDPAFPAAFPWFNTHRYWEERVLELREQVGAMQEGPLWPV